MVFSQVPGQVADFTGLEVHLAYITVVALDEGYAFAIGRPIGTLTVVEQLGVERRRIVKDMFGRLRNECIRHSGSPLR